MKSVCVSTKDGGFGFRVANRLVHSCSSVNASMIFQMFAIQSIELFVHHPILRFHANSIQVLEALVPR